MSNITSFDYLNHRLMKNGKPTSWANMIDGLSANRRQAELVFNFNYPLNLKENEDILSALLEFTFFSCLVILKDREAERISKISLNIIDAQSPTVALHNILINYYKFIFTAIHNRLEINVNNCQIMFIESNVINQITHNYLPAFPMNEASYRYLFNTTMSDFLEETHETFNGIFFDSENEDVDTQFTKYLICFIRENMYKDLIPNSVVRKELYNWLNEMASKLTLFEAVLCAIYYDNYKNIDDQRVTIKNVTDVLSSYVEHARAIAIGVREICENILKHTQEKTGLFYLRIHTNRDAKALNLPVDYYEAGRSWIEIAVLDFNKRGILDTFALSTSDEKIELEDMFTFVYEAEGVRKQLENIEKQFNNNKGIPVRSSSDIYHLLFHMGLKVYKNLIIKYDGLFSVSTIDALKTAGALSFLVYGDVKQSFIDLNHELGTKYRVILPIKKRSAEVMPDYGVRFGSVNLDYYNVLPDYLEENAVKNFTWEADDIIDLLSKDSMTIPKMTEEIITKLAMIIPPKSKAVVIDFSILLNIKNCYLDLYKILYYYLLLALERSSNCEYVIFVGLSSEVFLSFKASYLTLLNKTETNTNQHSKPWVFFFDDKGDPFVLNGLNEEKNNSYNAYYHSFRLMNYYKGDAAPLKVEEQNALIFPVEILPGIGLNSVAFYSHIKHLLSLKFGESDFGMKHIKHVKLGSKIHADSFFQAEMLFENSYYTDCFAYILARDILLKANSNNVILVGYKEYSKMLIEKIRQLLKFKFPSVKAITFYEEFGRLQYEFEGLISNEIESSTFVFVVPISSSLKTFNKMYADCTRSVRATTSMLDFVFSNAPINYSIIEIRDCPHEPSTPTACTALEHELGWDSVENNTIRVMHDFPFYGKEKDKNQIINCFIIESTVWHKASDCSICKEKKTPLFRTQESQLVLSNNVGLPYMASRESYLAIKDNSAMQESVLHELSNHMSYGHIQRGENEFLYYFDTAAFFEALRNDESKNESLKKWARKVKSDLNSKDKTYINILLVPEHFSNSAFAEWVLENMFNRTGIIIRENFEKDFYSNFIDKYQYIINIQSNSVQLKFYFIDDCLASGRTFLRCRALAKELIPKEKQSQERSFEITVISLVSRLDYQNYELVKRLSENCFSYVEVYLPAIRELSGECWLCREYSFMKLLEKNSIDNHAKQFIANRREKYLEKTNLSNGHSQNIKKYIDRSKQPYIKQRFLLINEIHSRLSNFRTEKIKSEALAIKLGFAYNSTGLFIAKNILEESTPVDMQYKKNMVRVLSMPFLCDFIVIREIAHELCMAEIDLVLSTKKSKESSEYLASLTTHLSMLDSTIIIDADYLKRIFEYLDEENDRLIFRIALQRLCVTDQVLELQLIRNALILLEEADDDLKEFLVWIILENNSILYNSREYILRDKLLSTEENLQGVIGNYYYETLREMWSLFEPDINSQRIYFIMSDLIEADEQRVMSIENEPNRLGSMIYQIIGSDNTTQPLNFYFFSDSCCSAVSKYDANRQPPDRDVPIFKLEGVFFANYRVDERHNCTIFLSSEYKKALLYNKLILFLKKLFKPSLNQHRNRIQHDNPKTAKQEVGD